MKKISYTFVSFFIVLTVFTACEPDTLIEERIVEVEVPVVQIDSVFIQESSFGKITYTQVMQGDYVTLQSGLNHYAHITIEDYQDFEIDMSFSSHSQTWIDKNVFSDGAVVIQTNEPGIDIDLDNDDVGLDGLLLLDENQLSEFDIYINADLLSNSALTFPEVYIRLEKEESLGDEQRLIWVRFDKEYVNADNDEDLGLIGLNGEESIELYIDIGVDVEPLSDPTFSEAEVSIDIQQKSGDNLILDVNSFEFKVNDVMYNINDLPENIEISMTSNVAIQLPDAYVIQTNEEVDIDVTIIAPDETIIELISYNWIGQNTDFDSILYLNKFIQM